jgi:hypothetical protein
MSDKRSWLNLTKMEDVLCFLGVVTLAACDGLEPIYKSSQPSELSLIDAEKST